MIFLKNISFDCIFEKIYKLKFRSKNLKLKSSINENRKNSFNIIYLWHLKFSFASLQTTLLSITFKLIFRTFLNDQKFILIESLESLVIEK